CARRQHDLAAAYRERDRSDRPAKRDGCRRTGPGLHAHEPALAARHTRDRRSFSRDDVRVRTAHGRGPDLHFHLRRNVRNSRQGNLVAWLGDGSRARARRDAHRVTADPLLASPRSHRTARPHSDAFAAATRFSWTALRTRHAFGDIAVPRRLWRRAGNLAVTPGRRLLAGDSGDTGDDGDVYRGA